MNNMNNFVKNIITYYDNNKWDDMVNLFYDNKYTIVKLFNKYIDKNKNKNKNNYVDILGPYSKSVYEYHIRNTDNNSRQPLLRLTILHLIEQYNKLKLLEADELKTPKTKITYIVTIADNELKIKLFILYLLVYYLESEIRNIAMTDFMNKKSHVGIDYEFNNRIIALMQLNFETISASNTETNSYIWLVNPGEFDEEATKLLTKYLMINQRIYKIFHGADSLDIPYTYEILLKNNKDYILKFTRKLLDTRFLCEYYRLSIGEDKKCSIYDALKYFKTITNKKYEMLEDTHEKMGPVQDINWNIHRMSSYHVSYALYDVLFLKHFMVDIFNHIKDNTPQYINSYKYVIPLIRFIYIDRRNITDLIETSKVTVNLINNYLIKHKNKNITLITIYNQIMENFKIENKDIDFDFILTVGYLRKALVTLLKYIVYGVIQDNFKIYKNKREAYDQKIDIDIIYKKLEENNYKRMTYLLNLFKNEAEKKLLTLYAIIA